MCKNTNNDAFHSWPIQSGCDDALSLGLKRYGDLHTETSHFDPHFSRFFSHKLWSVQAFLKLNFCPLLFLVWVNILKITFQLLFVHSLLHWRADGQPSMPCLLSHSILSAMQSLHLKTRSQGRWEQHGTPTWKPWDVIASTYNSTGSSIGVIYAGDAWDMSPLFESTC